MNKNILFFQYPWRLWRERLKGVYRYAEKVGWHVQVVEHGRPGDMEAFFMRIRAWLRNLPKPCGILGANDTTSDLVLQACRMELIKVPDDIAVVGIDNDELLFDSDGGFKHRRLRRRAVGRTD